MTLKWCHCHKEELMNFDELYFSIMFIICRIDGEASPEAEQVQLNGEKEAETREGRSLIAYFAAAWKFFQMFA
jgi:hypothetical protein